MLRGTIARGQWLGRSLIGIAALLLVVTTAAAERPRIYAIQGARIVTAPGQTIERGTIVVRDGLIEAVGADVQAPADAQIIEAEEGWTVYPAFIDAASHLGTAEPQQGPGGGGGPPNFAALLSRQSGGGESRGAPHEISSITPQKAIVDELSFSDDKIERHRKLGFAISHTIPRSGVLRGQSAVIALRSGQPSELVIKDRWALVAALESGGFLSFQYPTSKIGAVAAIRQAFLDAQRKQQWEEQYNASPLGLQRPEFRASDRALISALKGETPVLFSANATLDHDRFSELAAEFGLQGFVLALGCHEDPIRLKGSGMPVLLPLKFPSKPELEDEDQLAATSIEDLQAYLNSAKLPARLVAEGVEFALTPPAVGSTTDFQKNLSKIIEAGLTPEQTLAALTTTPARLLGLSAVTGTLEAGKIANLIVVDGELFAEKPEIRYVFVDGKHEEFEAMEKKGDPDAQVDPRGTWEVTTQVMGRSNESTWTIEGSPGNYSGTSSGARGTRDFEKVELEGDALTVAVASPMGTMEITVIISGEEFEGETSIDTPQGSITIQVKGKRTSKPEGIR